MREFFQNLADGLAVFYRELVERGIDPSFAEELTQIVLREMLDAAKGMVQARQ
ncbi:MAG: hypothetical protein QXM53_00870 [Thermofilaceae archaeon]